MTATPSPLRLELHALDPDATAAWGRALGAAARDRLEDGLVLALHGDLGAGKTVFVKGVAVGLGVPADEHVVSPTFTIARSYPAGTGRWLHHVDAYRLSSAQELEDAGFEDMRGTGCLTCVEWAERVPDALPEDHRRIDAWIEMHDPEGEIAPGAEPTSPRTIRLEARAGAGAAVLEAMRS